VPENRSSPSVVRGKIDIEKLSTRLKNKNLEQATNYKPKKEP
jgi:hypothetical protein